MFTNQIFNLYVKTEFGIQLTAVVDMLHNQNKPIVDSQLIK